MPMCDDVLTEIRTANTRQLLDSGGHFAKYWGGGISTFMPSVYV